jgi:hypothetical protein
MKRIAGRSHMVTTLTTAEVRILNNVSIDRMFEINGDTEVVFELPSNLIDRTPVSEVYVEDEKGKYVLQVLTDGFYSYGYYYNKGQDGHGPEYKWSSNIDCINYNFDMELVDICINNIVFSCRRELFVAICNKLGIRSIPGTKGIFVGSKDRYIPEADLIAKFSEGELPPADDSVWYEIMADIDSYGNGDYRLEDMVIAILKDRGFSVCIDGERDSFGWVTRGIRVDGELMCLN